MVFPNAPLKLLCELIPPLNKISFQSHAIVDYIYLHLVALSAGGSYTPVLMNSGIALDV